MQGARPTSDRFCLVPFTHHTLHSHMPEHTWFPSGKLPPAPQYKEAAIRSHKFLSKFVVYVRDPSLLLGKHYFPEDFRSHRSSEGEDYRQEGPADLLPELPSDSGNKVRQQLRPHPLPTRHLQSWGWGTWGTCIPRRLQLLWGDLGRKPVQSIASPPFQSHS